MLELISAMLVTSQVHAQSCGPTKSEWTKCTINSDCIIIPNMCGHPTAINRKFERESKAFHQCKGMNVDCVPPERQNIKATTDCKAGLCSVN